MRGDTTALRYEPDGDFWPAPLSEVNSAVNEAYALAYAAIECIDTELLGTKAQIIVDLFFHLNECSKATRGAINRHELWATQTLFKAHFEACARTSYLVRTPDEEVWAGFVCGALLDFARVIRTTDTIADKHSPFDRRTFEAIERAIPRKKIVAPVSFERLVAKRDAATPVRECWTAKQSMLDLYSPVYRGMSSAAHSDFLFVRGSLKRRVAEIGGQFDDLSPIMTLTFMADCMALNELAACAQPTFDTRPIDDLYRRIPPIGMSSYDCNSAAHPSGNC